MSYIEIKLALEQEGYLAFIRTPKKDITFVMAGVPSAESLFKLDFSFNVWVTPKGATVEYFKGQVTIEKEVNTMEEFIEFVKVTFPTDQS